MSAQTGSAAAIGDKGKGKSAAEPQDVTMGEGGDDSSSEEEVDDDAPPPAEEVEEEASDNEIDKSNIIQGRRTRGKQIDFAAAAKDLPADDDEDEDDDFQSEQTQNTSLQRLQNVEKRIVKVLELAGSVMDELANPTGPRRESINNHVREFMQLIKDIQMALRDEIKSACDYRPFEKCDYSSRISNEICCKKLEYVMSQLDGMKETIDDYHTAV